MTDHKFTDYAIDIKKYAEALNHILGADSAYFAWDKDVDAIVEIITLAKKMENTIKSQKAEIEEKSKNITYAAKELIRLDRERSEVIKEFANNVVQELWKLNWHYGQLPCSEEDKTIQRAIKECIAVVERNTKVMTEGNHESQNT